MPQLISFKVTQVSETIVTALNLSDAIAIAEAELNDTEVELKANGTKPYGYVTTTGRHMSIHAQRI